MQIVDKDFIIGKHNVKITKLEGAVTVFYDKIKKYKSMVDEAKDSLSCMICFDVCGDVFILPCGHVGCQLCLLKWFTGMGLVDPEELSSALGDLALPFCSKSCPTCKVPFNSVPASGIRLKNIAESMGIMVPAMKLSYSEKCTWIDMFPAAPSHPGAPSREQMLEEMLAARREGHAAIQREQSERTRAQADRLAREQEERDQAEAERERAIANDPALRAAALLAARRASAERDNEFVAQTMTILNRGSDRLSRVSSTDPDFGSLVTREDRTTRADRVERVERAERVLIHELHTRLPNFDGSRGLPGGADPRLPVAGPLQRQQAEAFRDELNLTIPLITSDGTEGNVVGAAPALAPASQPQQAVRPAADPAQQTQQSAWSSVVIPPFPPVAATERQQSTRPAVVAPQSRQLTRDVVAAAARVLPAPRPIALAPTHASAAAQLQPAVRPATPSTPAQQATRPAAAVPQPSTRTPAATPATASAAVPTVAPAGAPSAASVTAPGGYPGLNPPPISQAHPATPAASSDVRARGRARASAAATAPFDHQAPAATATVTTSNVTVPPSDYGMPVWKKVATGLVTILVIAMLMPKVGWVERTLAPVHTFLGTAPA
ncbi:hypothetical protein IAT38_005399 [Cryptococcus sp. DSM 104549]